MNTDELERRAAGARHVRLAAELSYSDRVAVDRASIRAYVARDWRGQRDRKRIYWRDRLQRGGLREAIRVTEQLREWMMSVDATWPTQAQRDEDLATHQRVAAALAKIPRG